MSTFSPPPPPPPPSQQPPTTTPTHYYLTNLGLGYAIAIALGFLLLLSILLLASYICFRRRYRHGDRHGVNLGHRNPNADGGGGGVILPSIIFVDENNNEGDEEDQNGVVGLDQTIINSYPKFPYSNEMKMRIETICAICLCEYKDMEMMRMLPDCKHCFHLSCVDAWLKMNATCPVCRSSPLPTPLSTPLAEVVPLSQYSDGRRRR